MVDLLFEHIPERVERLTGKMSFAVGGVPGYVRAGMVFRAFFITARMILQV